jgi:hypothetical protein
MCAFVSAKDGKFLGKLLLRLDRMGFAGCDGWYLCSVAHRSSDRNDRFLLMMSMPAQCGLVLDARIWLAFFTVDFVLLVIVYQMMSLNSPLLFSVEPIAPKLISFFSKLPSLSRALLKIRHRFGGTKSKHYKFCHISASSDATFVSKRGKSAQYPGTVA